MINDHISLKLQIQGFHWYLTKEKLILNLVIMQRGFFGGKCKTEYNHILVKYLFGDELLNGRAAGDVA